MATERRESNWLFHFYFIFKFFITFIILFWIFSWHFIDGLAINFFVVFVKGFLFVIGKGSIVFHNNSFMIKSVSIVIGSECTGTAMYSLFIAFTVAYGFRWKKCLYGVLILIGLNLLRLFTLILAALISTNAFIFIHDFLWPSTFFIFTLITIIYYMRPK